MNSVLNEPIPQTAKCGICGAPLEFSGGSFGMTIEKCTGLSCLNRIPHKPLPDSLVLDERQRTVYGYGRKRGGR